MSGINCLLLVGMWMTSVPDAGHSTSRLPSFALALADPDKSVTAGREALNRWLDYPWYDRESDGVRPLDMKPRRQSSPEAVSTVNLDWLQALAWTLIAAVLIALAYFLIRAYLDYENRAAVSSAVRQGPATAVDRVEALPFMAARTQTDLLAEARRQYEQGNYREAMIYLFSFELIQLDRHGIIRLARGKTNRQYLREARTRGPLAGLLEQTMVAFEAVFFGQHELDRAGFESCWNEVNEFQRLAAQTS